MGNCPDRPLRSSSSQMASSPTPLANVSKQASDALGPCGFITSGGQARAGRTREELEMATLWGHRPGRVSQPGEVFASQAVQVGEDTMWQRIPEKMGGRGRAEIELITPMGKKAKV